MASENAELCAGSAPYVRAAWVTMPPAATTAIETAVTKDLFNISSASGDLLRRQP
jgi:hypothetical protein